MVVRGLSDPLDVPVERGSAPPALTPPWRRSRRGGRWLLACALAAALAWTFAPFILVALDAARRHRLFEGMAGLTPMDGWQYLAWTRDGAHGLIRNLYGSAGQALFVHPVWTPTALAQSAVHASAPALLGFWKALSAVVLAVGVVKLVRDHIPHQRPRARVAALGLALFGGLTPLIALMPSAWGSTARWQLYHAGGDLVPAMSLWDYAPLAIALGLMPFAIEAGRRVVGGETSKRYVARASLLGLLISWLHPWQGESLLIVFAASAVLARRTRSGRPDATWVRACLALMGAGAAPVLYYLLLSRVDHGWAISERNSVLAARIPWRSLLLCLVPILLIGVPGVRRAWSEERGHPLVLWLSATLLVVAVSYTGQYRALDGLTLPLVVLAVRGWPYGLSTRTARIAAPVALAALLVPFGTFAVSAFGDLRAADVRAYEEQRPDDIAALRLAARLDSRRLILAPDYLGTAVPALTDAPAWVGHPIWTPDAVDRAQSAGFVLSGLMPPDRTRAFVRATRAWALVQPCGWPGALEPALRSLGFVEHVVGCARVYVR